MGHPFPSRATNPASRDSMLKLAGGTTFVRFRTALGTLQDPCAPSTMAAKNHGPRRRLVRESWNSWNPAVRIIEVSNRKLLAS